MCELGERKGVCKKSQFSVGFVDRTPIRELFYNQKGQEKSIFLTKCTANLELRKASLCIGKGKEDQQKKRKEIFFHMGQDPGKEIYRYRRNDPMLTVLMWA